MKKIIAFIIIAILVSVFFNPGVSEPVQKTIKQATLTINGKDISFSYPSYCTIKIERLNSRESYADITPNGNDERLSVSNFYRSNVKIIWFTDGTDMINFLKTNNPQVTPVVLNDEMILFKVLSHSDSTWPYCIQVVITKEMGTCLLVQSENREKGATDDILFTVVDSLVDDVTPLLDFIEITDVNI